MNSLTHGTTYQLDLSRLESTPLGKHIAAEVDQEVKAGTLPESSRDWALFRRYTLAEGRSEDGKGFRVAIPVITREPYRERTSWAGFALSVLACVGFTAVVWWVRNH